MKWNLKSSESFLLLFCACFLACAQVDKDVAKESVDSLTGAQNTKDFPLPKQLDTLEWELYEYFESEKISASVHQNVFLRKKRPTTEFGESVNIKVAWADRIKMIDSSAWEITTSNGKITLKNNFSEGEDYVHYSFRGIEQDIVIFRIDGYEWYEFTFISTKSGAQLRCGGMPRVNSDGTKIICCNGDLTAMFTSNSMQYFSKNKKGEWQEGFELMFSTYEPFDAEWDTDGSIVCGFRLPAYIEPVEEEARYYRLRLKENIK
jgi:hypothetical protein